LGDAGDGVEFAADGQVALQGGAAEIVEGLFGDFGGDEGISVAIAAHPGGEADDAGNAECVAGIIGGQGVAQVILEAGEDLPERRGEGEAAFDFVENGRFSGADEIGLPPAGQFSEHAAAVKFVLAWQGGIELGEVFAKAAEFSADGAAFGFGGVGGEDEFDFEFIEELLDLLGGEAGGFETADGIAERFSAGGGPAVFFAFLQDANAVAVFGEIGQVELEAEGAGDVAGDIDGEGADAGFEGQFGLFDFVGFGMAAGLGEMEDFGGALEDGGVFLFVEDLGEHFAEHFGVVFEAVIAGGAGDELLGDKPMEG